MEFQKFSATENLYKILKTKKMLSEAYYSQTDSQIERINQKVEIFLQHYISYQQNNCMEWLSVAEFQCKNKIHSAMKYALFKLNSGRHS